VDGLAHETSRATAIAMKPRPRARMILHYRP
jgi:hypothetical protein